MPRQGEDPAFVKRVRDFGSEEGGIAVQGQRRISVRAKYCRVSDRGLTPESDSATCHRTFAFAAHQYEAALRPLGSEGCTTTARVPGSVGDDTVSYTHLRAHETDSYLVCRVEAGGKSNQTST